MIEKKCTLLNQLAFLIRVAIIGFGLSMSPFLIADVQAEDMDAADHTAKPTSDEQDTGTTTDEASDVAGVPPADIPDLTYTLSGLVHDVTEPHTAGQRAADWLGVDSPGTPLADWDIHVLLGDSVFAADNTDAAGRYEIPIKLRDLPEDANPADFSVVQVLPDENQWQQEAIIVWFAGQAMPAPVCARTPTTQPSGSNTSGENDRPETIPEGVRCDFFNVQTGSTDIEAFANAGTRPAQISRGSSGQSSNEEQQAMVAGTSIDATSDGVDITTESEDGVVHGATITLRATGDVSYDDSDVSELLHELEEIVHAIDSAHSNDSVELTAAIDLLEQAETAFAMLANM